MPYKSIEQKREYNKLRNRLRRNIVPEIVVPEIVVPEIVVPEIVVPEIVVPEIVVPEIVVPDPFIYDIMRFELLFDTIRMQELLLRKTRFNVWMNYHLSVLEELQIYFNKTN